VDLQKLNLDGLEEYRARQGEDAGDPDDEEEIDEFNTPLEKYTLGIVQDVLVTNMKAVTLACYLIEQTQNRNLQIAGCRLASFLMMSLNKRAQEKFVQHLKGDEEAALHLVKENIVVAPGKHVLDALGEIIGDFNRNGR